MKKKITATLIYTVSVEIEVDEDSLNTEEGLDAAHDKLVDEANSCLIDGVKPVIHDCSEDELID